DAVSCSACPTKHCNKKLLRDDSYEWRCEKCDKLYPAPDHIAQDPTGTIWSSGFNDVGRIILPMDATELTAIKEGDGAQYQKITTEATDQTFALVCCAKKETHIDISRTECSIICIASVDWVSPALQKAESLPDYILHALYHLRI
ncbi:hypothetical protein MJO29_012354, partial [Puccinia striiformis f. sp. tritici]